MRAVRLLAWPGMPAPEAVERAARTLGVRVEREDISSNEVLEERVREDPRFDVIFPSDYMVERLRGEGRLAEVGADQLPLERLEAWAADAEHDRGCRHSVPFAFGTTGVLHDSRRITVSSWRDVFEPAPDARVGMLSEVRELIGAALIAAGHSPNDADALEEAVALLQRQRPAVVRYDSDDFVGPVEAGEVVAHQAWSGPAAAAVRRQPHLRYVVPEEGAVLWLTAAAVPVSAPDPELSRRLIRELMNPELAAMTTASYGYATPNAAARKLLPAELRDDPALFPPQEALERCHVLRDLAPADLRRFDAVWSELLASVA
jgi:spermidine/putrescine-binding protein